MSTILAPRGSPCRIAGAFLIAAAVIATASCGSNLDNPAAPGAIAAGTAPASSGGVAAVASARSQTPVGICHRTEGANAFILISVATPAVERHIRHGDARVGDPVPGQAGMTFGPDCTPVPAGGPVLDQSNITFLTFGGEGAPGSAVSRLQSVAQTFTVGISGVLTRIDLGLYKDPGTVGDLTLDILPASALTVFDLSPSLYSRTIPIGSVPLLTTTLTSIDVSAANLTVSAGDQYAIVLRRSEGAGGSPWVVWQDSDPAVPYGGGEFFTHPAGFFEWVPVSGDHRFRTWVMP